MTQVFIIPGDSMKVNLLMFSFVISVCRVSWKKFPFDENGFDSFRCLQPAFELLFPYGYDRIRERFAQVFPEDSAAIDDYLSAVRRFIILSHT